MIASTLVLGGMCSVYTRQKRKKKKKKRKQAVRIIQKKWTHVRGRIRAVRRLQETWRCHRAHIVSKRAVHAAYGAAMQVLGDSAMTSASLLLERTPFSPDEDEMDVWSSCETDDSYTPYDSEDSEEFHLRYRGLHLFKRVFYNDSLRGRSTT